LNFTHNASHITAFQKALEGISSLCPGQRYAFSGLFGSSKSFLISEFFRNTLKPSIVLAPTQDDAEELYKEFLFFLGDNTAAIFPSWETLPLEIQTPHPDITASRLEVMYRLIGKDIGILIVTPQSLMQKTVPEGILRKYIRHIRLNTEVGLEKLIEDLISMGYLRTGIVEGLGEMSIRGGILDVFPPMYSNPVRMEFFGDEVSSIRFFDPDTQRSLDTISDKGCNTGTTHILDEVVIIPSKEIIINSDTKQKAAQKIKARSKEIEIAGNTAEIFSERIKEGIIFSGIDSLLPVFFDHAESILSYTGTDMPVFIINSGRVKDEIKRFSGEIKEMEARMKDGRQFFLEPSLLYLPEELLFTCLDNMAVISLSDIGTHSKTFTSHDAEEIRLNAMSNMDIRQDMAAIALHISGRERSQAKNEGMLLPLSSRIKEWQKEGWKIFITNHNIGSAERLKELLEGYDLSPEIITKNKSIYEYLSDDTKNGLWLATGNIPSGFRLPELKLAIITEDEIFGAGVRRRSPSLRKTETFLTQLSDLNTGDYVVHTMHGIGTYHGLKRINIEGIENDFLIIEYQGGDKLYLPVTKLNLVGKYIGAEGMIPAIDKLGGAGWEKVKSKAKKGIREMAGELLKLYAEREMRTGFAFSKPDRLFAEFEASFEYDETPDQLRTIEEALKDMQEDKPMDRLICGDVGYGKTEVAMRAAFKAVIDNKQVAVLVPTTILAQQHYLTFTKRFSAYPAIIEVVSRFKSVREQKEILKRLSKGGIDIIIGTHRLLQKDVSFRDLGLIIIDEEQWFGVAHKERLKQLRKEVDVLTLTATPIPRTLHMSLSGIRDLSIINTPPEDRLAIKTIVTTFDDSVIRDAVIREISRGGQVFFVHNRVQSMNVIQDYLKRVVPEVKIGAAHGQMERHALENVMLGFINREFDILLSTAIIESGLDIPSANTIIINRADRFGLAQLYQLRGRVGRSKHRAYSYLLIPPESAITGDASKRLQVIQELSELGSGFRIAAHDMEIRGAGELLGTVQSGRIADIGFELYTQMLEEAVMELKGEKKEPETEPEINLKVSAYIPDNYIPDMKQRLNTYKRMASAASKEEIEDLRYEIIDRFGKCPPTVTNLFRIMELKLLLKILRASELSLKGERLYLTFAKDAAVPPEKVLNLIKQAPNRFRIMPDSRVVMFVEHGRDIFEDANCLLQKFL